MMNNASIITKLLNTNDPDEIEKFEKVLFDAFKVISDPSLDAIWIIDRSKRTIKTRIPYCSQEIMTARKGNSIIAASAVNFNMKAKLQLEEFGFSIDKNECFICEGLYIFNRHSDLSYVLAFKERLFEYLISRNIEKVYSTCSQRRIRGYRLLGFKDIDMRSFNGVNKYLLMMELKRSD